ncbi:uncharacterized protein LOC126366970 [Pectinophora gossypiella]|uniref:uncharacterized protein LOC126366970 n=1 Tax=Pectinophora gossypiella TaxID=13191 RepID=UPI00214F0015|nr:uncharacterized protein LOC126366970 [Pectinophora gossypiella]
MCRTVHALLSTVICGTQMLVRVFMTTILMLENIIRMIMQTLYNFISFMLQMVSLIPICVVFLLTARMKCFMCGGGGPCPVNRGGACDCLMSVFAIIILFLIFRATGVLDKIFYTIGYAKATSHIARFVPTPGEITECSRNDTDTEYIFYPVETTTEEYYDEEENSTTFATFGSESVSDAENAATTEETAAILRFTPTHTYIESYSTYYNTPSISGPGKFRADIEEVDLGAGDKARWWEENRVSVFVITNMTRTPV